MMKNPKILLFCTFFLNTSLVIAAGAHGEHEASVTSLALPFFNFVIFLLIIYWKLFPILRTMFNENYEKITKTINETKLKIEAADLKYRNQLAKNNALPGMLNELEVSAKYQVDEMNNLFKKETEDKLNKLKIDAEDKIKAYKHSILQKLNNEVIEEVFTKAKDKIKSDSPLRTQLNDKMIKELK